MEAHQPQLPFPEPEPVVVPEPAEVIPYRVITGPEHRRLKSPPTTAEVHRAWSGMTEEEKAEQIERNQRGADAARAILRASKK